MSHDQQRTALANSLLERVEMKRDIAQIKAELVKRADAITKLGGLLRSSPQLIDIGGQNMSPDFAQRAQKFDVEDLDLKRIAVLVDELRTKTDRLNVAERHIKEMGYSPD
jgi:hypothetical protein